MDQVMNRRDFLIRAAGVVAGAGLAERVVSADPTWAASGGTINASRAFIYSEDGSFVAELDGLIGPADSMEIEVRVDEPVRIKMRGLRMKCRELPEPTLPPELIQAQNDLWSAEVRRWALEVDKHVLGG